MITDYINRLGLNLAPTPKNDPKQLGLVKCLVRRPFIIAAEGDQNGWLLPIGVEIKLPRREALHLQGLGKVQILEV
jgi:hypothetical protein